jgi:hypothetical protein
MTARPDDAALALKLFDRTFTGPSWASWRAWLCSVLGLPLSEKEAAIYRTCTARQSLPTARARESWVVAGRRSGKSRMAAFMACCLAALSQQKLAPGERGTVLIIAADRRQARVVFGYCLALLQSTPALAELIVRQTQNAIDLSTGCSIEVATCSYRSTRGDTLKCCIGDEVGYWLSDDSAVPDVEVFRSVRPSLATVPGAMLIGISSPYARRGELFTVYDKHFGRDGDDVLVWQAETRRMNPNVAQSVIDRAFTDDPAAAAAEWDAQFRSDLEDLFSREALAAVIVRGRHELLPAPGCTYTAFVDPSGGRNDSMTLAIAHKDAAGLAVLDLVREIHPPFNPEGAVAEFASELRRYGLSAVLSDAYAGEWVPSAFSRFGITCEPSPLTRSELYLELLPLTNSGSVQLLDDARLISQLCSLERRTGRSGKDAIDHRSGQHDDKANAAAGALVCAVRGSGLPVLPPDFVSCNRVESVPGFEAPSCYLLGGSFPGSNDTVCGSCSGHQFARAAHRAARERDQTTPDLRTFVRERLAPNDFSERVAFASWRIRDHGL